MQLETTQIETVSKFDSFLNEANDPVTICGFAYSPADAMRKLDPDNYNLLFEAWNELQVRPRLELVRNGEGH